MRRALGVSILAHLLVLPWIGWLDPSGPSARVEPEEKVLRFDFASVTGRDRDASGVPTGGPAAPAGAAARAVPAPSSPVPAARPPRPALERSVPAPDRSPEAALEVPDEGAFAKGVSGGAPEASRSEDRFSVEGALRDFRRSLSAPSTPAPGSGDSRAGATGLAVPELPPLPNSGFGFGNLEFESRDFDWSEYARQIYVAIWRAWHNRLYLSTDVFERWGYQSQTALLDHQNRIRFTIEANGQVTGVRLETPSGCIPLDDSALDALREVILPPLPREFPRSRETIHARFIAHGDLRGLRPTLAYLKSHGFF